MFPENAQDQVASVVSTAKTAVKSVTSSTTFFAPLQYHAPFLTDHGTAGQLPLGQLSVSGGGGYAP